MAKVDDALKELLVIADRTQKAGEVGAAASIRMQVEKIKERSRLKYWSVMFGKPAARQKATGVVLAETSDRAIELLTAGNTQGKLAGITCDVREFPDQDQEGVTFVVEDVPPAS